MDGWYICRGEIEEVDRGGKRVEKANWDPRGERRSGE